MYRIVNKSTENLVIAGCLENKWGTINERRIDIDFFVVVNLMMMIILLLN
jgi:hypothetical protein